MGTVEAIATAYLAEAGGDWEEALRRVVADALADLCEAERRTRRAERLISRGYARGRVGIARPPALLAGVARAEAAAISGRRDPPAEGPGEVKRPEPANSTGR